jgi:hypothetical protein
MVEGTHPKVLERLKEKQKKQHMYQDRRNTVETEKLNKGDKVTILALKIHGNLQPNFHGIYKIDGKTKAGNDYLTNSKHCFV